MPRHVLLGTNPRNILANQAHGRFRHPETQARATDVRSGMRPSWNMMLFWLTKVWTARHSISSRYLRAFRSPTMTCSCVLCPWDIPTQTSTPPLPCTILRTTVTAGFHSPAQRVWLPPICSVKQGMRLVTEGDIPPSCERPADLPSESGESLSSSSRVEVQSSSRSLVFKI